MNRIDQRFSQLKSSRRTGLIPFVTAGDPLPEATPALMHALVEGGADVIELGVPFSDPMADGPVIQHASERAVAKHVGLPDGVMSVGCVCRPEYLKQRRGRNEEFLMQTIALMPEAARRMQGAQRIGEVRVTGNYSYACERMAGLTLTPALCATLLKPVDPTHHEKRGFFGWFNRKFEHMTQRYESGVGRLLARSGRVMLTFAALTAILFLAFRQLPSAFLPEEDQGYFMTTIQLPADATVERTLDIVKTYEKHVASRPGIESNMSILWMACPWARFPTSSQPARTTCWS